MRDVLVVGIVIVGALFALRRPWIGVMLWTWISIMNPHRYTYGFAYDSQIAALAAAATLVGLLFTKERASPFKGAAPVLLALFMVWMTLSWLLGLDREGDTEAWSKVMKIDVMILVSLALLRTKTHIFALMWVCAASIALLAAKGGAFTLLNAGDYRVWGPPGSFIADNNAFALATVMTIPMVRFLQMQLTSRPARTTLTVVMVLMAAAAIGSHSRGGLLALIAMALVLWWRNRSRFLGGLVIVGVGVALVAFMPEHWTARMASIGAYEEDRSVQGRFSAWWVAFRVAQNNLFGIGFNLSRPELFAAHSPYPELGTPVAHSIYFQVLGHHGFIGLAIFLGLWIATFWAAARVRNRAASIPQARWCVDLAGMCQVSLVGYLVGGALLNLATFDLPYNLMALVVLTRAWVERRAWETEPAHAPGWWRIPGLVVPVSRH